MRKPMQMEWTDRLGNWLSGNASRTAALALLAGAVLSGPLAAVAEQPLLKLRPVPFKDVKIQDSFWAPRRETNRVASIPFSLEKLEVACFLELFEAERNAGHAVCLAPRRPKRILDLHVLKWHRPQLQQGLLCDSRKWSGQDRAGKERQCRRSRGVPGQPIPQPISPFHLHRLSHVLMAWLGSARKCQCCSGGRGFGRCETRCRGLKTATKTYTETQVIQKPCTTVVQRMYKGCTTDVQGNNRLATPEQHRSNTGATRSHRACAALAPRWRQAPHSGFPPDLLNVLSRPGRCSCTLPTRRCLGPQRADRAISLRFPV